MSGHVTFNYEIQKLTAHLDRMPQKLHDRLRRAIERQCIILTADVKDKFLKGQVLHVKTGLLRSRTTYRIIDQGTTITGIVGTSTPYAAIHEYGGVTRAHDIFPRNARALSWFGKGMAFRPERAGIRTQTGGFSAKATGQDFDGLSYAKVVHHPGSRIPARPYMKPAFEARRSAIVKALQEAVSGGSK